MKKNLGSRIANLIARIALFTLTLSLGTATALVAGETSGLALSNLAGASVRAVAAVEEGDVLYANMVGGVQPTGIYRSDDGGRNWQVVGSGPGVGLNALAVHPASPDVLYAGTNGGSLETVDSLWVSDNGGQTWRKFSLRLPADASGRIAGVTALAVDPNRPDALYVGTDGHGVYRFAAERGGYGYELMGGVSQYNAYVKGLVVGPDSKVYMLSNDGLFRDAGDAWQKLEALPDLAISLAVAPDDPRTLYAGTVSTGVYKSTDGGQTWSRLDNGLALIPGAALRVTALAVDEQNPERVVAAVAYGLGSQLAPEGVYESSDAGQRWTKLMDLDSVATQLTIERGVIYAATAGGLVRHGEPVAPLAGPVVSLAQLRGLAAPNALQVVILGLTVALAGLMLIGRVEWVIGRKRLLA